MCENKSFHMWFKKGNFAKNRWGTWLPLLLIVYRRSTLIVVADGRKTREGLTNSYSFKRLHNEAASYKNINLANEANPGLCEKWQLNKKLWLWASFHANRECFVKQTIITLTVFTLHIVKLTAKLQYANFVPANTSSEKWQQTYALTRATSPY